MKNRLTTLACLIGALPLLYACGSGEDAFTTTGSSTSNIISAGNFSIGFDSDTAVLTFGTAPAAGSTSGSCADLTSIDGTPTTKIIVTAGDKDNALVSSGRVYFKVEFGTLDQTYCDLQDGQCSVEWSAHTNIGVLTSVKDTFDCFVNGNGTIDLLNSVTAWTYGAEQFIDNDGDGRLSNSETYIDVDEPYLDRNDNRVFDVSIDDLTSADTNGVHDAASGDYNGPDCDTTTRTDCAGASLIPIYFNAYMLMY